MKNNQKAIQTDTTRALLVNQNGTLKKWSNNPQEVRKKTLKRKNS